MSDTTDPKNKTYRVYYLPVGRMPSLIRAERMRKELTLEQLSKLTGCTQPHLSNIESGETMPTLDTLEVIFTALNIKLFSSRHYAGQKNHDVQIEGE
jgi:transcriptional regulator with XRE-family HTH domain